MILSLLLMLAVIAPGVLQVRELAIAAGREARRPRPVLLDTRYTRIDGRHYATHNVVRLSTGVLELPWDILETCGMPDATRRPVHGPI